MTLCELCFGLHAKRKRLFFRKKTTFRQEQIMLNLVLLWRKCRKLTVRHVVLCIFIVLKNVVWVFFAFYENSICFLHNIFEKMASFFWWGCGVCSTEQAEFKKMDSTAARKTKFICVNSNSSPIKKFWIYSDDLCGFKTYFETCFKSWIWNAQNN